jgi:hypothetical protein
MSLRERLQQYQMLDSPLCHSAEDETVPLYDLWMNDR